MYCGDHGLYFGSVTAVTDRYKVDFKFDTVNVDFTTGFALRTTVNKDSSSDFCIVKSQNCFMFTSTSSTVCEEQASALLVDRAITVEVTSSTGN